MCPCLVILYLQVSTDTDPAGTDTDPGIVRAVFSNLCSYYVELLCGSQPCFATVSQEAERVLCVGRAARAIDHLIEALLRVYGSTGCHLLASTSGTTNLGDEGIFSLQLTVCVPVLILEYTVHAIRHPSPCRRPNSVDNSVAMSKRTSQSTSQALGVGNYRFGKTLGLGSFGKGQPHVSTLLWSHS